MGTERAERPAPRIDEESRGFWEACARGELVLQRCGACGRRRHPPRAVCPACLASAVVWERASGRGVVYSYTVVHQNHAPGFRERVPYVLAVVELEEGVRLMTNVVGCAPETVRIGLAVEVDWEALGPELAVPVFRPRA